MMNINNRKIVQERQLTKRNQQEKILNEGRKPDYICIGVQKAGTSSLINYLNEHPHIFMKSKECHFFNKPKQQKLNKEDFKLYERRFITQKQYVGEKTPSYSCLPYSINKIRKYNPNMKLIIILREPISRAFSQYNMYKNSADPKKRKKVNSTFDNEIQSELHLEIKTPTDPKTLTSTGKYYIIRGRYIEQIEHILSIFPRKQLYIGISEQIKANKDSEYKKITNFITNQLDSKEIYSNSNKNTNKKDVNIGNYKKNPPLVRTLKSNYMNISNLTMKNYINFLDIE